MLLPTGTGAGVLRPFFLDALMDVFLCGIPEISLAHIVYQRHERQRRVQLTPI